LPGIGVGLGLSHYGKNADEGCFRMALTRHFGPTREEVIDGWIKLHSNELHNLLTKCYQDDQSRMRQVGHVAHKQETGKLMREETTED
jgi:hypothetical protein